MIVIKRKKDRDEVSTLHDKQSSLSSTREEMKQFANKILHGSESD